MKTDLIKMTRNKQDKKDLESIFGDGFDKEDQ
jgi:hypothetical protein